jgi:diadenosine tetraphosphate (Ap4A) HIT family hydrolase
VCLALYPITKGHTVIVWKKGLPDLRDLSDAEYDYLMEVVDITRDALLQALKVEKVYLMYMDEARHVHWHLVPRYNEQGFNVFMHEPARTSDFSLAPHVREIFAERMQTRTLKLPIS